MLQAIRRLVDARKIARSGLFDPLYYLESNPDVAEAAKDPLRHYLAAGADEGRDPHPMFDTSYYLASNPDVALSGLNPLLHFIAFGAREGRRPHPNFDAQELLGNARKTRSAPGATAGFEPRPRPGKAPRARHAPEGQSRGRGKRRSLASSGRAWLRRRLAPDHLMPIALSVVGQPASGKPVLLCVSHVLPAPPRAGNELRIHRLLAWLSRSGFEVHLVVAPLPGDTVDEARAERAAAFYPNLVVCLPEGTVLYSLGASAARASLAKLRGTRPGGAAGSGEPAVSPQVAAIERAFCPDYLIEVLGALSRAVRPAVVLANYVFMSRALMLFDPGVMKVIDTHDVFSTKQRKVVQFGVADSLAIDARDEAALLRRADLVLAIQPEEQRELENLVPGTRVVTAGVDFELSDAQAPGPAGPIVLYVASDNPLNVKGLGDFLRLAWPRILQRVPGARLRVVGSVGRAFPSAPSGVELVGRVEDLGTAYAAARVVVNPAVAGTGLKVKTIEALCHLRPVVAWPSGVEGLPEDAGQLCAVARDWYEFGELVARTLADEGAVGRVRDRREDLGRMFSSESVYGPLSDVLRPLLARARGASE